MEDTIIYIISSILDVVYSSFAVLTDTVFFLLISFSLMISYILPIVLIMSVLYVIYKVLKNKRVKSFAIYITAFVVFLIAVIWLVIGYVIGLSFFGVLPWKVMDVPDDE